MTQNQGCQGGERFQEKLNAAVDGAILQRIELVERITRHDRPVTYISVSAEGTSYAEQTIYSAGNSNPQR